MRRRQTSAADRRAGAGAGTARLADVLPSGRPSTDTVGVAQLAEHLVVVQDVAGSSPVTHPESSLQDNNFPVGPFCTGTPRGHEPPETPLPDVQNCLCRPPMASKPEKRRNGDDTTSWRIAWRENSKEQSETFRSQQDAQSRHPRASSRSSALEPDDPRPPISLDQGAQ
jgi:hypothetical protein